ncbi:MAG: IS30 family transposase [candidate division Zixibacteria bacterium]|nr:IS30 family transposase [candidate division Zixibacteria bacterium]
MRFKNLLASERLEIGILRGKGYSLRAVAKALNRSPNTISYELRKNRTRGVYEPRKAQAKARLRKRMRRLQWMKLEQDAELRQAVIRGLERAWNPGEISGRMRAKKKPRYVSKNSIYRWLYSNRGQRYCPLLYTRRYRRRPRRKMGRRTLVPNRVGLAERFRGANTRSRYGHWEKDAVVSRRGTSASLAVAQERKSRLVAARKVEDMSPWKHEQAVREMLRDKKVLSLTRDNGIENRCHEETPIPSFFCDPYSSWQKGGVENANKLIRRFFPKGTDFRRVSQRRIDTVVLMINEKPRRILGYRSALEVAEKAGIMKSINGGVS